MNPDKPGREIAGYVRNGHRITLRVEMLPSQFSVRDYRLTMWKGPRLFFTNSSLVKGGLYHTKSVRNILKSHPPLLEAWEQFHEFKDSLRE